MFTPTEKQLEAITNMEKFCDISDHRTFFETKQDFDEYFVRLQKKGSKKAKILENVSSGKITFKEINKKIEEKKYSFYSNYDNLRKYTIEYINRYFPTIRQTEDILYEKCKDESLVKKVLDSVKHLIDEEKMVNNLVSQLRYRGKNINFISNKLYTKKFDGFLINKTIKNLRSEGTLLKDYSLEEKFKYYKNKGKSKYEIRKIFIERNEDKDIVDKTLEKVFGEVGEIESIKDLIEEYKKRSVDGKKIISRLLAKGFKYKDILTELNG